jgi:RNA polymerase sigma factor (sigma-70 family)
VITNFYKDYSDTQLLEAFAKTQNNQLLGILLQRYTLMLFGTCIKYLKNEALAKDAVQQVFLKAIEEIPKYKIDFFKSWIYMVAKNHCLLQLRKNKYTTPINEDFEIENLPFNIDEFIKKDNQFELLHSELLQLNNDQKICIDLFYLQKKSYNDIVATTNYSLLQVKSNIQNGKRNLKIALEKKQNNEPK